MGEGQPARDHLLVRVCGQVAQPFLFEQASQQPAAHLPPAPPSPSVCRSRSASEVAFNMTIVAYENSTVNRSLWDVGNTFIVCRGGHVWPGAQVSLVE